MKIFYRNFHIFLLLICRNVKYSRRQWNGLIKTVLYQASSNLPILYTLPGGKIARSHIAQHVYAFSLHNNKSYLSVSDKKLTWDKSLILNNISSSNDKISVSNENPNSILKEKIKRTEPKTSANNVNLSICGDCTMQEAEI